MHFHPGCTAAHQRECDYAFVETPEGAAVDVTEQAAEAAEAEEPERRIPKGLLGPRAETAAAA